MSGSRIRFISAFLWLLLGFGSLAQSTTWYVATTGNDSSSCGTSAAPCAKVQYLLDNKVSAGDTIKIKPGSYSNQGTISLSDTIKHRNLILTADEQSNKPQLLNTGIDIGGGVSGVTVSYLRLKLLSEPGDLYSGVINVTGYPTVIDNNELSNGGQGVFIWTSKLVTVSNNYIHDLGTPGSDYDNMCVLITNWAETPAATSYDEAIRVVGNQLGPNCSGDGVQENSSQGPFPYAYLILADNNCHDNQEQCFDFKGTPFVKIYNNDIYRNGYGGISDNSSYGGTPNFEIYSNKIHDHSNFAILTQGSASNWKVYNNLIYNNLQSPDYNYCAVQMPGDSGSAFYHNTVYNNGDGSGPRFTCGILTNGNNSQIKNNIFYNNGVGDNGHILNDVGTPDFNYFYPQSGEIGTNTSSACYASGNCPGFINPSSGDFRLLSRSPAINKGTSLPAPFNSDYSGLSRPQGTKSDLGAYEYQSSGQTMQVPGRLRLGR